MFLLCHVVFVCLYSSKRLNCLRLGGVFTSLLQVQESLDTVMRNHTVLVIAHRLSTVQHADTIVVLDDGVVMEQGSHDKLMDLQGLYYRLVQRQMLGFEELRRPVTEAGPNREQEEEEEEEHSGDEDVPRY